MAYEVKHVSPSQITTFRRCPRRWFLEKVEGRVSPPSEAQKLGTEVHDIVEHYIEHGRLIPDNLAGQIAKAALPMVHRESKCEHQFKLDLVDGISVTGRIDYTRKGVIEDLKTTSDMRYAKTPQELETDAQALIYLWAARRDPKLLQYGPIDRFAHLIVCKKYPHTTRRVDIKLSEDAIQAGIEEIKREALEIKRISKLARCDVPVNLTACDDYGGCKQQGVCLQDGVFHKEDGMSDYIAKLRAERAERAETTTIEETPKIVQKGAPAPEPEPMPENLGSGPVNPPDGLDEVATVEPPTLKKAKARGVLLPVWYTGEHADPDGRTVRSLKKTEAASVWISIKETIYQSPPTNIADLYDVMDWSPDGKTAAAIKEQLRALISALGEYQPAAQEEPVTAQEGTATAQEEPVTAQEGTATAQEGTATAPEEPAQKEPAQESEGLRLLFVNCKPTWTMPLHLDEYLGPIRAHVQEHDKDKRHWQQINDYGLRGAQVVAATLAATLETKKYNMPPMLYADLRYPGHAEVVEVLRHFYKSIEA